jgi:chromosome segregation protein
MKLKYIELRGFKSFAKKETLDFEKQITAIVGPNGSGKSNIAEAFRFVLGEQSMKSLRSKKTEDLLFNGSSSMPRVNRASVSLVFDNSNKEIKQAFDEITIERIIHRDATNEYYINGSLARLKDITEMLAEAKIGSAGHHIISQGEADKMLSMTAKERKKYLEEALGLTQYQNKRSDALKKLEKTKENLASIKSLIRELAPHVRYLEREMKLIEKKKELSRNLETITREYIELYAPFLEYELKQKENSLIKISQKIIELKGHELEGGEKEKENIFSEERKVLENKIDLVTQKWSELRRETSERERLVGRLEAKFELLKEASTVEQSTEEIFPDASKRLIEIRDILESVREEQNLSVVLSTVEKVLSLLKKKEVKLSSSEKHSENALSLELESELTELKTVIAEKIKEEHRLMKEKEELEKAYSQTFQNEEREKNDIEKELMELRSLEVLKNTLLREVETLNQDKKYFYASLEEVVILTGAHFTEDIKKALQQPPIQTERNVLRDSEHEVERLKLKIEGMQVGNTKEVETEFNSAKNREDFLKNEVKDLELTSEKLIQISENIHAKIDDEFKSGIKDIGSYFSTFFSQMFNGGNAGLSLVSLKSRKIEGEDDDEDEEENQGGVEVVLSMPHKKLRSVAMLSGGEKTLVSIALIFALSQVNPPPFLILDETDAALDEANSRRYGEALKELAKHSQLILITHNRETMSRASRLYGITMGNASTSELLSIDLEEAEKIIR